MVLPVELLYHRTVYFSSVTTLYQKNNGVTFDLLEKALFRYHAYTAYGAYGINAEYH